MNEREQICYSLITWLETFPLQSPHSSPSDLSDGVAIAQALSLIAPNFFTQPWLAKIKSEDLSNWRLKVTNLKKILKGILEYNLEYLGVTMQGFQMPDVNAIGEHSDAQELGRLLQLVLNVAINCDNKQEYIQTIMSMEEDVQQIIKNAIQELMTKEASPSDDIESALQDELKKTVDELNAALEAKGELLQRCHELDAQVASLQEERHSLISDRDKLEERLQLAESLEDLSTPAGKKLTQLQHQVESLQEEIYKLESGKDDYRIKYEVLNKDYTELKEKNAELSKLASESRAMKDELDILRHTSDQLAKSEALVESYKKKLEDLSDLKGQMKMLEEKNTKYMKQQIEMEEELKRVTILKQQLESYKRQTLEAQSKLTEETRRADKAEFEFTSLQNKLFTLQKEKERILSERDSLREMNDELKCTQLQTSGMGLAGELDDHSSSVEMLSLPSEIKERLLRLEHENKMLKISSTSSPEETIALTEQLEDANSKNNVLQTELRLLNQQLMKVQAELEDTRENEKSTSAASNTEFVSMKTLLSESKLKLEEKDLQLQQKQQHINDLSERWATANERVIELANHLAKKDEEIKVMEEKYRKYLEKAKNVINSLDPRHGNDSSSELYTLKNQLHEKDTYINFLESDQERMKNVRDQEERLIVTAWYNLGMQLHRQAAEERLANSSMGQSFLARQRQVHTRRSNTVSSVHSSTNASELEEGVANIQTTSTTTTKRRFSFRKAKQTSPTSASVRKPSMSVSVQPTIQQAEEPFPQISPNHFNGGNKPKLPQ
ncbi:protein Hook 3 isoform X1 [Biomphalaria glabrata]|uniref:Calponin-homology (CH) domain-containing protein n=1 Tax=Biomphalaria glabrata TaxID=6526 RepID=A0A2C9LV51_BIOGL|nr:protein Hook 3 isoform X1 [Biomphalaria glabrata]